MCVFVFYIILSEAFLILGRTEGYLVKNVYNTRYCCKMLMKV